MEVKSMWTGGMGVILFVQVCALCDLPGRIRNKLQFVKRCSVRVSEVRALDSHS